MAIIPKRNVDFGVVGAYPNVLKYIIKTSRLFNPIRPDNKENFIMKKLLTALLLLSVLAFTSASATTVKLTRGKGLPGGLATLILEIDAIPTDLELALELELFYDPTKLQYIPNSSKNLELFRDEVGSALAFSEVLEDVNPTGRSSNAYFNLIASYNRAPTGTELISLDFRIAADTSGEIPITVELTSDNPVNFIQGAGIEVSAVPIPPAFLLFGAPLAWLFTRVRQG